MLVKINLQARFLYKNIQMKVIEMNSTHFIDFLKHKLSGKYFQLEYLVFFLFLHVKKC